MKNLDTIIGDIIFISFIDVERYKFIGINNDKGHFLLKGYDNLGIWIEHPGIKFIDDNYEQDINTANKYSENEFIQADFMVSWNNINTLMHYPDRKGFDLPNIYSKKMGFKANN